MSNYAPIAIPDLISRLEQMQDDGMLYVSFSRVPEGYVILGIERPEDYNEESVSSYEYGFIPTLGKASPQ